MVRLVVVSYVPSQIRVFVRKKIKNCNYRGKWRLGSLQMLRATAVDSLHNHHRVGLQPPLEVAFAQNAVSNSDQDPNVVSHHPSYWKRRLGRQPPLATAAVV
jgi:hypothetical protein